MFPSSIPSNSCNITVEASYAAGDCYGDNKNPLCLLLVFSSVLVVLLNLVALITAIFIIKNINNVNYPVTSSGFNVNHMSEFYLIANLAFCDLITGLLSIIIYIWDYILQGVNHQVEDIYTCRIHLAMLLVPFSASIFSLLAIASDRFIFIKYGLRYSIIITTNRIKAISVAIWLISLTNALSIAMPWTYPEASGRTYCHTCMMVEASSDIYIAFYSILFNIIPIITIIILYSRIVIEGIKAKHRLETFNLELKLLKISLGNNVSITWKGRQVKPDPHLTGVQGTFCYTNDMADGKDQRAGGNCLVTLSYEQLIRRRDSFTRSIPYLWQMKGVRTLGILVFAVTLFWLPFSCGLLVFIHTHDFSVAAEINSIFVWFGNLNSLINPIIYAFGYTEFRRNLTNLIKFTFCAETAPKPRV